MCGRMDVHEHTDCGEPSELPSPLGGAGGILGRIPPPDASDEELDGYCEWLYNIGMQHFAALVAANRKPRRRKKFSDYTKQNCEESYASRFQA